VCKSVNTKPHMIKLSIIYLSEEEYKCAQVRKHKTAHNKNIYLLSGKEIYAQVCK